jgi:hypothetical protein
LYHLERERQIVLGFRRLNRLIAYGLTYRLHTSPAELQERKVTVLASIRNAVLGRTPIPGGYQYEFAIEGTTSRDVLRMVELEQQCCKCLNFNVTQNEKTIWLDVTGQSEALAVIGDLFG